MSPASTGASWDWGIVAKPKTGSTVSQALQQVAEQADIEASGALARVTTDTPAALDGTPKEPNNSLQQAAKAIEKELKDPDLKESVVEGMPPAMARAFETTIQKFAAGEEVIDSWDSADLADDVKDIEAAARQNDKRIFDFPMKPFVSITVQPTPQATASIRDDVQMKIASLKREFDQVDRTLATATNNHIVYAMAKTGGFRVIRQEDGANQHVFKKNGNAVFNVAISNAQGQDPEPILATDTNGSVYWTEVPTPSVAPTLEDNLTGGGFQFPPLPSQDDNTSGAQLKTRAKLSSRHPEFFALGRGKSIYIIWPKIALLPKYCDTNTRVVDPVKYFNERSLKIATGKAGKDFTFSQDDTVIASLDKAGRLKFWDIQDHANPQVAASESISRQVETKIPLMTVLTSALDKSAATSVHFIDKDRPYSKGSALRYMIVGSKQNHILTLWDLALGKPVQEICFPQETDTDPICSIAFNAKTGLVILGHPKRNSIYLIALSAPKYNLSHMSQASYIDRLAKEDPTLPKPESTAIMSSMREISIESVGQLRSLGISNPSHVGDQKDETMLEVYVMHSRGVTCLNLKRQDIGINSDGKALEPANALKSNLIKIDDLRPIVTLEGSEVGSETIAKPKPASTAGETATAAKNGAQSVKKDHAETPRAAPQPLSTAAPSMIASTRTVPAQSPSKNPPQKPITGESKAILKNPVTASKPAPTSAPIAAVVSPARPKPLTFASVLQADKNTREVPQPTREAKTPNRTENVLIPEELSSQMNGTLSQSIANSMGGVLSKTFADVLSDQLEKLYKRIDDDRRVQEAAGAAKQDAILRLVASTLTENVERTLAGIIGNNIQNQVVPSVQGVIAQSVDKHVADSLLRQLQATIPRELKTALAPAVGRAMQDPETLRIISDLVTAKVSSHVEEVFAVTLRNSIAPAFTNLAIESTRQVVGQVEGQVREQLRATEIKLLNDSAKIDQLTALTTELLQTVKTMAGAQGDLQTEILHLKTEVARLRLQQDGGVGGSSDSQSGPKAVAVDPELDAVDKAMASGNVELGTMQWLQSARHTEMFDKIFVRLNPGYLRDMNQVVILSVAAAVSTSFESNLTARLAWLNAVLEYIDVNNADIATHAFGVINTILERLQESYMAISEQSPHDPQLPQISKFVRRLRAFKQGI